MIINTIINSFLVYHRYHYYTDLIDKIIIIIITIYLGVFLSINYTINKLLITGSVFW